MKNDEETKTEREYPLYQAPYQYKTEGRPEPQKYKNWEGEDVETPKCQKCSSYRVIKLEIRNTAIVISLANAVRRGQYILASVSTRDAKDETFSLHMCLECGQVQGSFPIPKTQLEYDLEEIPF